MKQILNLVFFVITMLTMTSPLIAVAGDETVTIYVQNAVLAEDWRKVADLLSNVDASNLSPTLRILKGHACLALNRNNESLALFASALNDSDRKAWRTWADKLASNQSEKGTASYPKDDAHARRKEAIAWYLKGDACARLKEWKAAEEAFGRAINLNPDCYLAWNARGVVAHAVGNTLQARAYFLKATQARKDFSDAYSNRGTLNVYQSSVKGESVYEEARRYSADKEPLLPLIGLGCTTYGKQDYDAAVKYFEKVPQTSPIYRLAQQDALASEVAKLYGAVSSARNVGMAIQKVELNSKADQPISDVIVTEDGEIHIVLEDGEYIIYPVPGNQDEDEDSGSGTSGMKAPTEEELRERWPFRHGILVDPIPEPSRLEIITSAVASAASKVIQQVATATPATPTPTRMGITNPGGADSDVSKVRSNRGQWLVRNVYGLLYVIEERPSAQPRTKPMPVKGQ